MNQHKADLQEFICNAKRTLKKFENDLGWSKTTDESHVQCPVNAGHQVPIKSLKVHARRCKWRKAGYTQKEVDEIIADEDCNFPGPRVFTDDIIAKVAPGIPPLRTHERFVTTLTPAERLQVYDQIIERLHVNRKQKKEKPEILVDLYAKNLDKNSATSVKNNMTMVKELRDHKRRRQTYRAKNVHVTKRSQTEIIRDVLAVHMEQLHRTWNPDMSPTSPEHDVPANSSRSHSERGPHGDPPRQRYEGPARARSPQRRHDHRRSVSYERKGSDDVKFDASDGAGLRLDRRRRSRDREPHKHSRRDHQSKKHKKRSREESKSRSKHKKHKSERQRDYTE